MILAYHAGFAFMSLEVAEDPAEHVDVFGELLYHCVCLSCCGVHLVQGWAGTGVS